jgi:hypothetical protein
VAEGRTEEALVEAKAESDDMRKLWSLAIVDWTLGRTTESDEALAQLERNYGDSAAYQVAEVRAVRRDFDAAFEWLERAFETRDAGVARAKTSTLLNPLHGDPRWRAFMRRIRLEP